MTIPPQRFSPASTGRIRAQQRQLQKQMLEDANTVKPAPSPWDTCQHCNYAIDMNTRLCSKCFRRNE